MHDLQVVIFVSLLITPIDSSLKLCDYLRLIGRSVPECSEEGADIKDGFVDLPFDPLDEVAVTVSPLAQIISKIEKKERERELASIRSIESGSRWDICAGPRYKDCRPDGSCASGYSCIGRRQFNRCCLRQSANFVAPKLYDKCPSTSELGYVCTSGSPVKKTNWCRKDEHCASAPTQMCCDTGCGFNICLQSNGYVIDNGIRFIRNPKCPPPDSLEMKCYQSARKLTNWCNDDKECQNVGGSLQLQTNIHRYCCPTPCGYNTCVSDFNGKYVIG